MRKKELLKKIEELNAKVFQLEQYAGTQDALVSEYKKREEKIVDILLEAQKHAESLKNDTDAKCSQLLTDAQDKAAKLIKDAEDISGQIVSEARQKVEEYRKTVKEYNNTLLNAAKGAREQADRFAQYAKNQVMEPEELDSETDYFANDPSKEPVIEGVTNPALLMHNIYKLQNRELPEDIVYPEKMDAEEQELPNSLKRLVTGTTAEEPEQPVQQQMPAENEQEPEEAELKKVSELLDKENLEQNSQEPNLDSLLDEIINFGETKDGERKE